MYKVIESDMSASYAVVDEGHGKSIMVTPTLPGVWLPLPVARVPWGAGVSKLDARDRAERICYLLNAYGLDWPMPTAEETAAIEAHQTAVKDDGDWASHCCRKSDKVTDGSAALCGCGGEDTEDTIAERARRDAAPLDVRDEQLPAGTDPLDLHLGG